MPLKGKLINFDIGAFFDRLDSTAIPLEGLRTGSPLTGVVVIFSSFENTSSTPYYLYYTIQACTYMCS